MLDRYELIKKDSVDAVIDIFNHNFNTGISKQEVSVSAPTVISGRRTQVTLTALSHPGIPQRVVNARSFIYKRMYLSDIFDSSELNVQIQIPGNTVDVLEALKQHHDFAYSADDFVFENIPDGSSQYTLKTKPGSLRWIGTQIVSIAPLPPEIEFEQTILDGLDPFTVEDNEE